MLIATLPSVHREELMEEIISHPLVHEVRYNTGMVSGFSPKKTLEMILEITEKYGKKLWVDLKNRQLRVKHWAYPDYGQIELNFPIKIDLPAKVFFRGDEQPYELKLVRENVIYVDPTPKFAVGEGQAVNIIGNNLVINNGRFISEKDKDYIMASLDLGIKKFMLSFIESIDDIYETEYFIEPDEAKYGGYFFLLKIESLKGIEFANSFVPGSFKSLTQNSDLNLIAARDDLMIHIGENKAEMFEFLKDIIFNDQGAVCASRIFSSLEYQDAPSLADFSDLALMRALGYENFMLSDGICGRHFQKAMKAWEHFLSIWDSKLRL